MAFHKRFHRHHKHHKFHTHNFNQHKHPTIEHKFNKANWFVRKHPVFSAVSTFILSLILIRISLSDTLFGRSMAELRLWIILIAIVLILVSLFTLKWWWRNRVPDRFTKRNINLRTR